MIRFETQSHQCRFFDRFDDEARRFEDRLRSAAASVDSIPWPRISFWQGYRHLQSLSGRYFVLQMLGKRSGKQHQIAVVERVSRFAYFKTGVIPYWIPSQEPESRADQEDLLQTLKALCLEHTSLMSVRAHAYVPGEPALDAAEKMLRDAGFEACERESPEKTRLIDLRPPIEEVLSRFPSKIRTKLKIKKPDELRVEELRSRDRIPDLRAALDDSFLRSADQRGDCDFDSLFNVLEKSPDAAAAFGLFLSEETDSPKAFITGVASPPLFEYTVAGSRSDPRLRQFPFNYILLWRLVEAAKALGASTFDMGGITDGGEGDPLAGISDFKRRFPGSETSVGREGLLRLRPARCRAYGLLRAFSRR